MERRGTVIVGLNIPTIKFYICLPILVLWRKNY